ncbi:MAG: T9SS type A sorting domain-containing protein [Bacteroidales bacterium]|nr:T9SS type A sorting domain-containing protein [Bacteroidales bacterium]
MKYLFVLIIVSITLLLTTPSTVKANHYAGSDITYTCLGGNTYLITYTYYRNCEGVSAPAQRTIDFNCSSNSTYNFSAPLLQVFGTGQELTQACSAFQTNCSGGNAFGVQEYVYQGQVTLIGCNSWEITFSGCCRSPVSTVAPSGSSYTTIAVLNNNAVLSNSSPTFTNKPVLVACNGQSLYINHGATDSDGDSLVYSFYSPFTNYPNTLNYSGSYSETNFLQSSTPITIDSATGDIHFTPSALLSTIMGVKVEEYRKVNGTPTLIGTIYRDLLLIVILCNTSAPTLSGLDTSLSKSYSPNDTIFSLDECLTNPISFNIYGFDADTFNPNISGNPEKFSISWNNDILGATFTPHHNGTDSAFATFSWTPNSFDVNKKHCFIATIQDEACSYNAFQSYTYCITPRAMFVDIGSDTLLCEGESITLRADADPSTVNYIWNINGSPFGVPQTQDSLVFNSSVSGPGVYNVSIETNNGDPNMNCAGSDDITLEVIYQPQINATLADTTICDRDSVIYDAGIGQSYRWTNIYSSNIVGTSQIYFASIGGLYELLVDGGVNSRCTDIDTFSLAINPSPLTFNFGNDTTISSNQSLTLSMPAAANQEYLWSTGDTISSIIIDNSFNWNNKIIGTTINSFQCYSTDTIYVYIGSASIQNNSNSKLKIYPNPVQNNLFIELDKDYGTAKIEIYDLSGKLFHKEQFTGKLHRINAVEKLPKGMYLLQLQNDELNINMRFAKK